MHRPTASSSIDPLVIGVDVARFGSNDTVLYPRFGLDARSFPYKRFNGLDGVQVAEQVILMLQEFASVGRKCNGLFIDGGGLGAGPIDILRRLGYNPIDINMGGKPSSMKYRFKVDEMWGRLRDALISGLALPNDPELAAQLTQREYGLTAAGARINLESKGQMHDRLGNSYGASPDVADALALTYAQEVALPDNFSDMLRDAKTSNEELLNLSRAGQTNWDYDPMETRW
jgi:hypothetical protein